jgi:hypothetical protein
VLDRVAGKEERPLQCHCHFLIHAIVGLCKHDLHLLLFEGDGALGRLDLGGGGWVSRRVLQMRVSATRGLAMAQPAWQPISRDHDREIQLINPSAHSQD